MSQKLDHAPPLEVDLHIAQVVEISQLKVSLTE